MNIGARIENSGGRHKVQLSTNGQEHSIAIPAKAEDQGSSANGGELLFLALATCYCNDLYREAAKRGMEIAGVTVEVTGEFGGVGEPARNIEYRAAVTTNSSREEALALMQHTDSVAEIHNTLRRASPVVLGACRINGV